MIAPNESVIRIYELVKAAEAGKMAKESVAMEVNRLAAELNESGIGKGVILVPPSYASRAAKILRERGCTVSTRPGVTTSHEQYQASNAYFLGQWQSYLSALEGSLERTQDESDAISFLQLALDLSKRFVKDVRELPVASVPEDVVMLSMKSRMEDTLNAFASKSEQRFSSLASLRNDVEIQLNVLRKQGQSVLAAL